MPNMESDYDHFMVDNVLRRSDLDQEFKATHPTHPLSDPQKQEVLTLVKILLSTAGYPLTEANISIALDWVKGRDAGQIRNQSESERNATKKDFRKFMHKQLRAAENKFMGRVGTIHVKEAQPSSDTIFRSVKSHIDKVAERERTEPSEKSPLAQADIAELAKRFSTMGVQFERPQGTSLHHFLDDLKEHEHVKNNLTTWEFFKNEFQSFVIEHNWSKAFEGVKDFDGGEIKLPFAYICFEFRINGIRLLIFLGESEGCIEGILASGINKRWYINPNKVIFDGKSLAHSPELEYDEGVLEYLKQIGQQIRAVCIMLDAKVAVGEKRSQGEALQKKRAREGKAPLRDYHVVSLAKRFRGEHERGEPTGIHKRLHMRRGHWRHFKTPGGEVQYYDEGGHTVSKTWINWMLVGSENLGFVDKHYRL